MAKFAYLWLPVAAACGFPRPMALSDAPDNTPDAASMNDASRPPADVAGPSDSAQPPVDAPGSRARCDATKPFAAPTLVPNVNSEHDERDFSLTRDEKIAFVTRSATSTSSMILAARRSSVDMEFSPPTQDLTVAINQANSDSYTASPTADGLTLYVSRGTDSGVYMATRQDVDSVFDAGVVVTLASHALTSNAFYAKISGDGDTLYYGDQSFSQTFSASRVGNAAFDGEFLVGPMISAPIVLSDDELTMYYAGSSSVMISSRANKTAVFGAGSLVPNVSSSAFDLPVALTSDGCVLYISSNRAEGLGGFDIWEAHRPQ